MEKNLGIVAINESEHLDGELKDKLGGELYTLYFYNPEESTFLCEATPSYYLVPFGYYSKTRLSDDDDSEYRSDILGEPIYMHCRSVDNLDESFKTTTVIELDEDDDFVEKALDAMNANPEEPPHALSLPEG